MDKEQQELNEEARRQVAYEKTIVESTVMKTKFVLETLTAAGFCEEHAADMLAPVLLASNLQQISEILTQSANCQEELLDTVKAICEQQESSQEYLGALAKYGIGIKN